MRSTSVWRCSCGSVLQAVIARPDPDKEEFETAMCPSCYRFIQVQGYVVELVLLDEAKEASA
jgi:hypothetical protein